MMPDESKALDILGLKGVSDAIKIATEGIRDGAAAFLSRVCLPAAEEFGLALRDRVSAWRARNLTQTLNMANEIHLRHPGHVDERVNPRLIHLAMEEASWTDDDQIQKMWAGLLASSGSLEASDENLTFMNLLKQLSSLQVRILRFAAETAKKYATLEGFVMAEAFNIPANEPPSLFGADLHRIDRELDHLASLNLIGLVRGQGGIFNPAANLTAADLTPTALALHLYTRGQGSKRSPADFWNLKG
jgi:hypothetical protein